MAFPGEALLSIFFMLGIVIGEIGGISVASRIEYFEAAGRPKDKHSLVAAWIAIILLNVFEMFNIAISSNTILNNVPSIRESLDMLFNIGLLQGPELSGAILAIIMAVVLPCVALIYWAVSAGIRSAERYLDFHGALDKTGQLINPELRLGKKEDAGTPPASFRGGTT
jgi:hypothetical protein